MVERYDDAPRCYDGQQIWSLMVGNCGTTDTLADAQETAGKFRTMHGDVAEELARIQMEIGEAWVGESGDAAKEPLLTLREMSALASTNLEPSRTSFDDQSRAYVDAKGKIAPVPEEPEQAGWWGRGTVGPARRERRTWVAPAALAAPSAAGMAAQGRCRRLRT